MRTDSKPHSFKGTVRSARKQHTKAQRQGPRKKPTPRGKPAASPKKPKGNAGPPRFKLEDSQGFVSSFLARVGLEALNDLEKIRHHNAGAPPRSLSRAELLILLVFHYTTHLAGGLAEHLVLFGITMTASNLSERRQATPWQVFDELMKLFLKPVATKEEHPEAFYQGLRLTAMDASEFSLTNTEDIKKKVAKADSRRGKAAFAKLRCSVLLELFSHNPLAARLGKEGQSEWVLSLSLLEQLPQKVLVLVDRLYGCAAFVWELMKALEAREGHFLVRVRSSIKVLAVKKKLKDGSRIVEVAVRKKGSRQIIGTIVVREIVVKAQRKGLRPVTVRLWTSLLDPKTSPAEELARLYMKRWEHELYFRELKHQMMTGDLLQSQMLETACQEVAAMIIGTAMVAGERAQLEPGQELKTRISFIKTWEYLETLWVMLLVGSDIVSQKQKEALVERFRWIVSQMRTPKKRNRSCPRAVMQPVRKWPRKRDQQSSQGEIQIFVLKN